MLELLKKSEFEEIYGIMEQSFPKTERRTYDGQKALLADDDYMFYGVHSGKSVSAFLAVWDFEKTLYVEHFAVSPNFRNSGLGSSMLRELCGICADKPVCLEVELPENDMARRRIGFYERNGFVLNHYDYIQPSMAQGQPSIPLLIMTNPKAVTQEEFESIKSLLYKRVYKVSAVESGRL